MDRIPVACPDFLDHMDRWLSCVREGNEVSLLIDGKEAAVLTAPDLPFTFLTDSLVGILKQEEDSCGS